MQHDFGTVSMDTLVQITVISDGPRAEVEPHVKRAFEWFATVERVCSRFDPDSEVMCLARTGGQPTRVSTLLLELVTFAVELAELSDGAFDPTLGVELEQRGYTTNYRTGEQVTSGITPMNVSFRDVVIDRAASTIALRQPLVLDLNSVAKGLALDLAGEELRELADFSIEAGGDLVVRGHSASGQPWRVGIQDPRSETLLPHQMQLTDVAVCTSGDYERGQHVLDGRTREAVSGLASVTVVAPTAVMADGLSTVVMALGPERGRDLLRRHDLAGVLVTAAGELVSYP